MTIHFFIRKKALKTHCAGLNETRSTVYVRLKDGAGIDQSSRTNVMVNPALWDAKREIIVESALYSEFERNSVCVELTRLRLYLISNYVTDKIGGKVTSEWLKKSLMMCQNGNNNDGISLISVFDSYVELHTMSESRKKQYYALSRTLSRYECYVSKVKRCSKVRHLNLDDVNADVLQGLWKYIKDEDRLYAEHPSYFDDAVSSKPPRPRSSNTMSDIFKKLRAFFKWCEDTGRIGSSPFHNFKIQGELYGTPVYLTQDEVNRVMNHNFSRYPHLARQRDIFVFQCNVGCRVGDLIRFRKDDVVNGEITYIPQKTRSERPQSVTVPLNSIAQGIVSKYSRKGGESLLPFISPQKYNVAIKQVLQKAGITRTVVVLDPLTRSEKKVRICDVGSSHMARRTFAGNLYKKVKDPALVAALTGHKEGSKAFARYRAIDDDMKRELVEMLE